MTSKNVVVDVPGEKMYSSAPALPLRISRAGVAMTVAPPTSMISSIRTSRPDTMSI